MCSTTIILPLGKIIAVVQVRAAHLPVGIESSRSISYPTHLHGEWTVRHRPYRLSLPAFAALWAAHLPIGVGMAVVGHPSLRTGLADFPHPALQLVSHPLAAGLVRLARAKAYREISPSFSKNALG